MRGTKPSFKLLTFNWLSCIMTWRRVISAGWRVATWAPKLMLSVRIASLLVGVKSLFILQPTLSPINSLRIVGTDTRVVAFGIDYWGNFCMGCWSSSTGGWLFSFPWIFMSLLTLQSEIFCPWFFQHRLHFPANIKFGQKELHSRIKTQIAIPIHMPETWAPTTG